VDDARRITGAIASGDGEAFARLYEDRFDFMYALVRRRTGLDEAACLDIERRLRRRERAAAAPERVAPEQPDDDRLEWLRRELGSLERANADLIDLRFRAGMTLGAIGRRVGLSPGAVDGRINRTLAQLRRRAGEEQEDRHG